MSVDPVTACEFLHRLQIYENSPLLSLRPSTQGADHRTRMVSCLISAQTHTPSRLLSLPPELLNRIATLLFEHDSKELHINASGKPSPHPLAQTCRQLRKHYRLQWLIAGLRSAPIVNIHLHDFSWARAREALDILMTIYPWTGSTTECREIRFKHHFLRPVWGNLEHKIARDMSHWAFNAMSMGKGHNVRITGAVVEVARGANPEAVRQPSCEQEHVVGH